MSRLPIRLLLTIPNFRTAGGGQVVVDLCTHLDPAVVTPTVCVAERFGTGLEDRLVELGVPLVEHPFTVPPRPLATLPARVWAASCPFRGLDVDVWHSWHYIDDYTEPLVARAAGVRRWVFTKKSMAWSSPGWNGRGWEVRSALATRIATTNSDMPALYFDKPWLRGRTELIPFGVDLNRYASSAPLDLAARGVPAGAPVVTAVARVVREKSLDVLVRAVALVPGAHLVVAGRTDAEDHVADLRAVIDEEQVGDRVHLLGHVDDVPALLAATDVFVLPTGSNAEGCPVSVLEAMAAARPCVVADTPGSHDVVADGRTGFVVPIGDHVAMGRAIGALVAEPDLRRAMGASGRDRVSRDYTLGREAHAYEDFYRRVVGADRPGERPG